MKHIRAVMIIVGCALTFPSSAGAVEQSIWKWQPPYDPPKTLTPLLASKGISIEQWRFCEAIRYRTRDLLITLLDAGANPRASCEMSPQSEIPAIFFALSSTSADPEIVKALVNKGASVNERYTPSYKADSEQSLWGKFIWVILGSTQNTDYFPLYYAAKYTNSKTVEQLLQLGADVNAQTGGHRMTAMFVARDLDIAEVLLRFGANPNDKDAGGSTVLKAVKNSLAPLSKTHYLRPSLEAYVAWLEAHGAHE